MATIKHLANFGSKLVRLSRFAEATGFMVRPRAQLTDKTNSEELVLSDKCIKRLKKISEGPDDYLRVTVDGGGCSGFQYGFRFDNHVNEDDRVFEKDGVKVVIDQLSLDFVKGSTLDYNAELIRSSFRIVQNPNADQGCSCGASFSLKLDG